MTVKYNKKEIECREYIKAQNKKRREASAKSIVDKELKTIEASHKKTGKVMKVERKKADLELTKKLKRGKKTTTKK